MTILERPRGGLHEACSLVLETDRLILRAPRLEDAKAVATLADDRRIAENTLRIPHPYGLGNAEDWIAVSNMDGGEDTFLITRADDGAVLGSCALRWTTDETPEIGYWLGTPHWGRGYATEAARALIDHAFGEHGVEAIVAGARTSNPGSRRVLEKCGFQWTGVELHRIRAIRSSAPFDRFRLERAIWASLKGWGRTATKVRCSA